MAKPAATQPRVRRTRRVRTGTATQSRGRDRAAQILTAARAVMVEDGYAALTTRKVAARVGIRLSNVQYYFATKVDLVRALFEHSKAHSSRVIATRLAEQRALPEARLFGAVDYFLEEHHSLDDQRFQRELWALAAHDPAVASVMRSMYRGWLAQTARNVLAINPGLGRRRAERRALLVISLVDGLSLMHGSAGLDHPALDGIEREVRDAIRELVRR